MVKRTISEICWIFVPILFCIAATIGLSGFQASSNARAIRFGTSLPSSPNVGDIFLRTGTTTPGIYVCFNQGQWTLESSTSGSTGPINTNQGVYVACEQPSIQIITTFSSANIPITDMAAMTLQYQPIGPIALYLNGYRIPPTQYTVSASTIGVVNAYYYGIVPSTTQTTVTMPASQSQSLVCVDYWHQ